MLLHRLLPSLLLLALPWVGAGCDVLFVGDRPDSSEGSLKGIRKCSCMAMNIGDPTYVITCTVPDSREMFIDPGFHIQVPSTTEPGRYLANRQSSYVLGGFGGGPSFSAGHVIHYEFGADEIVELPGDNQSKRIDLLIHHLYVPEQTAGSISISALNATAPIDEGELFGLSMSCYKGEYSGVHF